MKYTTLDKAMEKDPVKKAAARKKMVEDVNVLMKQRREEKDPVKKAAIEKKSK